MGISVSTGFTAYNAPRDDLQGALLALVRSAVRSLHVCIYGFHLPLLTDTLCAAHAAGLDVSVILDHSQAAGKAEAGEVQKLVAAAVPLVVGTSPEHHQILHTKQVIVDMHWVEDGSYNYSLSAGFQANTMHVIDSVDYAIHQIAEHQFLARFIETHQQVYQPTGAVAIALNTLADPTAPTTRDQNLRAVRNSLAAVADVTHQAEPEGA